MRKALLALSAFGAILTTAVPAGAAEGVTVVHVGVNTGFHGVQTATWTTSPLTDPNNHQITHYCNFSINGVGNDVVITIVANATAGAHVAAVATGVYCDVRDRNGAIVHYATFAAPGPSASIVSPSGLMTNNGPYTVCSFGNGLWTPDAHLYQTPLACQAPNLPIVPPAP